MRCFVFMASPCVACVHHLTLALQCAMTITIFELLCYSSTFVMWTMSLMQNN